MLQVILYNLLLIRFYFHIRARGDLNGT
jgi:hypothetical protein